MSGKLSKSDLLQRFVLGLEAAGALILHLSSSHPYKFRVLYRGKSWDVICYLWNLTGGGNHRPTDEYRIQITPNVPFLKEENSTTLILGWYEPLQVFAGFDIEHHLGDLGKSPSIQIRAHALQSAAKQGFGFHEKESTGEIAIAFRPEFALTYLKNFAEFHKSIASAEERAAFQEIEKKGTDSDREIINKIKDPKRKKVLRETMQAVRASDFARRVLGAYKRRCCLCGMQLGLLDAAHILPVSEEESTDETNNGMALCAIHHRAYDRAIYTIDEKYRVIRNGDLLKKLKDLKQGFGAKRLFIGVDDQIRLPEKKADNPSIDMIKLANIARGWDI